MDRNKQLEKVNIIYKRLDAINPRNDPELAMFSHLVGATHSIRKAVDLSTDGYSDEHLLPDFADRVLSTAKEMTSPNSSLDPAWEAGYYFNSAIMRIAAVNERLGKYIKGDRTDFTPEVRKEVNRIKHDVEGILHGRKVNFEDALTSLDNLTNAMLTVQERSGA
jgi:hypothetical protein